MEIFRYIAWSAVALGWVATPARAQDEALEGERVEPPVEQPSVEPAPEPAGAAPDAEFTDPALPDELAEDAAPAALSTVERGELWKLDDRRAASVPWNDFDRRTEYGPPGLFHAGAQLRAGVLLGPFELPFLEIGVVLDVRYRQRSPWHFRAVLAFAWQPEDASGYYGRSGSAQWLVRLLPLSLDAGDYVSFRAGGHVGAQWAGELDTGAFGFVGGAGGELALRLLDGRLELAITGGVQYTATLRGYGGISPEFGWMVGGQIGYLVF